MKRGVWCKSFILQPFGREV